MRASKFTEAQKAFSLKQAEDGLPVAEVRPPEPEGGALEAREPEWQPDRPDHGEIEPGTPSGLAPRRQFPEVSGRLPLRPSDPRIVILHPWR